MTIAIIITIALAVVFGIAMNLISDYDVKTGKEIVTLPLATVTVLGYVALVATVFLIFA